MPSARLPCAARARRRLRNSPLRGDYSCLSERKLMDWLTRPGCDIEINV
jgi:hypothetical protein